MMRAHHDMRGRTGTAHASHAAPSALPPYPTLRPSIRAQHIPCSSFSTWKQPLIQAQCATIMRPEALKGAPQLQTATSSRCTVACSATNDVNPPTADTTEEQRHSTTNMGAVDPSAGSSILLQSSTDGDAPAASVATTSNWPGVPNPCASPQATHITDIDRVRARLASWAHAAVPYVRPAAPSAPEPPRLVFAGRGLHKSRPAAAAGGSSNNAAVSGSSSGSLKMTGEQHAEEQLAAQVQALSEEVAHRVDGSMQFVEGRVGVPAAARVLAAHLDLLQDPRFLETWQFCAGLHGAGETGGDVRVAAMLLGALRGRDAFARLMRAGPYQAGRTLLWLRQELGAGRAEVVARLMPCYPQLLGRSVEELEQAVDDLEALGLFSSRQELRRLLAECPALLLPGVYEDELETLQRISRSRANKYVSSGSYHI